MKKPTMKSINAALPRLDTIRRKYMFHGETGFAHGYGVLSGAFADIDQDGNVEDITLYAVGDAMEERHYYNREGVVDITDVIEEHILKDWADDGNSRKFRRYVVFAIQDAIATSDDEE